MYRHFCNGIFIMKLKSLTVKNLRLFGNDNQTIQFDDAKSITVLLGDNGAGKTSLLYGCSVLFSQYTGAFPGTQKKMFTKEDVRNETNQRKSDYLHFGIEFAQTKSDISEFMPHNNETDAPGINVEMYLKGNNTRNVPESKLKAIKDYSQTIKQRIDNDEPVALPILAYYGTERGQIKPVERRRNFNDIFPRWDIYKSDSLESATDFKRFFTWFERNEDLERREQIARGDLKYRSHVLETVRSALNKLFTHLTRPRVETAPLRFVMDNISNPDNPIEERIERMSDGYRILVALVADIAARMAEANPTAECSGLDNPLDATGIVLIDEIDLHLHPTLQRDILHRLHNIFPNVQFIVSTHSPSVVIAALDIVQVVKIDQGIIDTSINTAEYENYDISLLLLSNLFGVNNVRTNQYYVLNEEYESLLAKPVLTDAEKQRIDELGTQLNRFTSVQLESIKKLLSDLSTKR